MPILLTITFASIIVTLLPFVMIKFYLSFNIPGIHFAFLGILLLIKLSTDKKLSNAFLTKRLGHQLSKNELSKKINFIKNTKDIILIILGLTIFLIEILK